MTPKRFTLLLLGMLALVLALSALINRVIDPFWYYRDIEIAGLNAVKTKFRWYERHVKPAIVAREQPDALILGSSYAEIGFDPLAPAFTAGGTLRGYNFGIAGASWADTYCSLLFALKHAQIKRVVLGVHPGALPAHDCTAGVADTSGPGWAELLLSATALKASVSTMLEQHQDPPSHTREGLYFYTRGSQDVLRHFREGLRVRLNAMPQCKLSASTAADEAPGVPTRSAAPLDLSALTAFLDVARARDIEVRIVFYPQHAYALELAVQCGRMRGVWEALRQTADLLEARLDVSRVEAWEFFGYNDITGEPVRNDMRYWQDPEHFNYEVGNLLLEDMFSTSASAQLGRRLERREIDARVNRFNAERAAHLKTHPWFFPELHALAPADRWVGGP